MRYYDLLSNFRLWYPEFTSIRDRFFTLFNFGKISLSVGPLWTSLTRTSLSFAGSRHSLTLPLGLGMSMKLLHHSTISSMPKGVIMSCCWSLYNSCLNGFCSAYATCHGGTCYGLLSGFNCNENILSKHPVPVNTSSNSFCSYFVISMLVFCHYLCLDLGENIQFHYCLRRGCYLVCCLNLNCHGCLRLSLCLGLERTFNLIIVNHWPVAS